MWLTSYVFLGPRHLFVRWEASAPASVTVFDFTLYTIAWLAIAVKFNAVNYALCVTTGGVGGPSANVPLYNL